VVGVRARGVGHSLDRQAHRVGPLVQDPGRRLDIVPLPAAAGGIHQPSQEGHLLALEPAIDRLVQTNSAHRSYPL